MLKFTQYLENNNAIQVGDTVGYSKKFLQSTGQYTGDAPAARGKVISLNKMASTTLAEIDWNKPDLPKKVNVANLSTTKKISLGEQHLIESEIKTTPIPGSEHWLMVSDRDAKKLSGGTLPRPGHERKIEHLGKSYWLAKTPHMGKQVWSIRLENGPYKGPFPMKIKN